MISWGDKIPHRIIDTPHIATDVFPTVLDACGINPELYETDGMSILKMLLGGEAQTHDYLFWEMEDQTAVRHCKYKLVLNGRTVESEAPRAEVFLSDLEADPGEKVNLCEDMPDLCRELTDKALACRQGIEENWEKNFAANYTLT